MINNSSLTTSSGITANETAGLRPRASLQNIGEKKDDDKKDGTHGGFQAFGADGFTFLDFLDIINPLQHIPVVSNLYRDLTGDEIDPASRVAGGTLFGGPIGAVVSLADVVIDESTGQDMGDHVLAWMGFEGGQPAATVALADPPLAEGLTAELQTADAGAITAHAEVTDWARRETSRFRGAAEAAVVTAPAGTGGDIASAASALRATRNAGDISGNIEVLNWARQEAAAARAMTDKAAALKSDQDTEIQQAEITDRQAATAWTVSAGIEPRQLAGATAPAGGWFSETMLTALSKYQESEALGKASDPRFGLKTVDVEN